MPIRYDESRWPFVVVTMPAEDVSDRDFATHLDRVSGYFSRGERFGLVIDARDAPPLNAERRRLVAERIDRDVERHRDQLIGSAVLLSSPIGRGVFKVIMWMTRSSHPMRSFAAVEPALQWLRGLVVAGRTPKPSDQSTSPHA
jgi:hypothetical protein